MARYSRGPTITRQLTEDEEQLDKRSSSFLQSESTMPQAFGTSSQRYAWMERDLKMRAMQAGVLKQEGDMATDLGDKRALAAQDTKLQEEELAARRGLSKVDEMVAGGMDYDEATLKVSSEMDLGLNEMFGTATSERSKLWMSPEDRAHKKAKQKLEGLQITKDTIDTEERLRMIQEDPEGYKKALRGLVEAGQISAAAAPLAAKAKALLDRQAYDDAEKKAAHVLTLGEGTDDNLAAVTKAFSKGPLAGVTMPENIVKLWGGEGSKNILLSLTNEDYMTDYMDRLDNERGLAPGTSATNFATAINTLTDDSLGADEAKKRQARSIVFGYAGDHQTDMMKVKEEKELSKAREASNTELGNSFKDANTSIDKILADTNIYDDSVKVESIAGAGRGFLDRFRALSTPGTEKIFDDYQGYFDALANPKDSKYNTPTKASNQARELMGNFIKEFKALQGKTPTAGKKDDGAASENKTTSAKPKIEIGTKKTLSNGKTAVFTKDGWAEE